ncbi:DUF2972 domain-containing protein [Campylobacter lari]|nr:DUF2972 domain-containing protein [Campylobacter lari]
MFNPHSAIDRIKNQLAYKLGFAIIEHKNYGGGGYISLIYKLYKIKKEHFLQRKIYKQTIQVFPHLTYPKLENCKDYNESIKYKFHLSYMLGSVLIDADRNKLKGGYLTLFKYIKHAKKNYNDIINIRNNISKSILKPILKNDIFFYKNYEKLNRILNNHNDYDVILELILHNLDYFIDNFDLIQEWLLSDDFSEEYKKENHPYPSLLDPKKLNNENEEINYNNISAELAWEMNLPLPDRYSMVYLWAACSGTMAIYTFFHYLGVSINNACGWECEKKVYLDNYIYLLNKNTLVAIAPRVFENNDKIYYLFNKNVALLYICRDPISIIRHAINHIGDQNSKIKSYMKNINLNSDINNLFPEIHYYYSDDNKPFLNTIYNVIENYEMYFKSNKRIDILKNKIKDILCLDIKKISGLDAIKTFDYISTSIFDINNKDYSLFEKRINRHQGDLVVLPVIYSIMIEDICVDILIITNNLFYYNSLSDTIRNQNYININTEIFNSRKLMFDNIVLLVKSNEYEILKNNQELFLASKKYLNEYMNALEKHEQKIKDNLITEEQILDYLKDKKDLRIKLKNILDEDLTYVRENHPEYLQKWKYYQEFKKICEND